MSPTSGINLLLTLVMGHFLGDYAFQSDRMAVEKCAGRDVTLSWKWWLCAHAAIHGFLVAVITGLPFLGLAEWIIHSFIDVGKCRGFYRMRMDQGLHLLCKVVWSILAASILGLRFF